jgi:hypothetical protein
LSLAVRCATVFQPHQLPAGCALAFSRRFFAHIERVHSYSHLSQLSLCLLTPSQWPPIKGLYRDAECVAWALQSLPLSLRPTAFIEHLSAFVVPALYDADNHTLSVHYFKKEWLPFPGNPDPIAHISQSEEASALLSALQPHPSLQHSVLEWYF